MYLLCDIYNPDKYEVICLITGDILKIGEEFYFPKKLVEFDNEITHIT